MCSVVEHRFSKGEITMPFCSANRNYNEPVAAFLARHVDASVKSQNAIAREAGFTRSNIISMLKMGVTKVPIERVPGLAAALEICEHDLLRRVLAEYQPGFLAMLDRLHSTRCQCPA
jgi:hypothetical protein